MSSDIESEDGTDTATLDPSIDGVLCQECDQKMGASDSFCRHCGFYPTLGRCVDVADWEQHFDNGEYIGPEEEEIPIWKAIPPWSWTLAGGLAVLVAISVAGSLLTPERSVPRTQWALGQTGIGLFVFLAVHFRLGVAALSRDKDLGILDLFTSPFRIWIEAIMDYPKSFRIVSIGGAGFVAVVLAHGILGVPYGDLINLDAKPVVKKKRKSPVAAMAKAAGGGGRNMTMEEALEEFAGNAGANDLAAAAGGPLEEDPAEEEKEVKTRELNCIVVGCLPTSPDNSTIRGIVVAVKMNGTWRSVGAVSNGLTPEVRDQLQTYTDTIRAAGPFVRCNHQAIWLKPRVRCLIEVSYTEEDDEPSDMKLLRLL